MQITCEKCKQIIPNPHVGKRFCGRRCADQVKSARYLEKHRSTVVARVCRWQKKMRASNPIFRKKQDARAVANQALRSGKIIRLEHCENCGAIAKLQLHHHKGYAREHWLDVQQLCHACHLKADRK